MSSRSQRLPAQTLRYFEKIILADSVDFDINYMAALIFEKCLDFEKNAYSRTAS